MALTAQIYGAPSNTTQKLDKKKSREFCICG